jgi:hypothetical protein
MLIVGLPAALMLVAGPARACDDRFPATCAPVPAVQEDAAPDTARAAGTAKQFRSTSLRKRAAARAAGRKAARVSIQERDRAARRTTSDRVSTQLTPVPPLPPPREQRAGPATAVAVTHAGDRPATPAVVESRDEGEGKVAFAGDDAVPLDRAVEPVVIVSAGERNEIDLAAMAQAQSQPEDPNWLARMLAALGAAFAAASVLRFLAA